MAVPRRKEQSRVGSVALVAVAGECRGRLAARQWRALRPRPTRNSVKTRDTADPDKGIATYVGGDMYVGKNPSTGVDAEGDITLSSSNTPDGSYAAGAEGLTVINGKLAMNPIKSSLWNDAATESNQNVNGGGGRRGPV